MRITLGSRTIVIHSGVKKILLDFAQHGPTQPEAGGIILGKLIEQEIHAMKISAPSSLDKSSRFSFERHKLSAQIVIDFEFLNSGGETVYLGEWHTHPEKNPNPSSTDSKMVRTQYREIERPTDFLILLIQGTESLFAGLYDGHNFESCLVPNEDM
ncbi:Mov34/MPN/PAD-1 family protein [Persicitalea sp.]|uniref:Mov34/MPN/PAD-1 family protein n=1 Tax=Persicitalea sp. TaxID=3100273 RepID=UPI0035936E4C